MKAIYRAGCEKFRAMPVPPHARHLSETIQSLCRDETVIQRASETLYVVTDPLEDADDTENFFLMYLLASSGLHIHLILSGGLRSPDERLTFLQGIIPELQFGVEYQGFLTLHPDGYLCTDAFDGLLMAGPCHSNTFRSLCANVNRAATFVGTDATGRIDSALPAPINCKKTDVEGCLTTDAAAWNASVDLLTGRCVITALPPDIGRRITTQEIFVHPLLASQKEKARLLTTSRPDPMFAERINLSNAIVIGGWPAVEYDETRFQHGAAVATEYLELAEKTLLPGAIESFIVPAVFTIIEAALRGAVYLPGKFGSPTKTFTDYLTPESIDVLNETMAGLPTPMYDVAGLVILLEALCLL